MELNFDAQKDYLGGDILFYIKDTKPDNKICLICHFKNSTYDKLKLSCKHTFHSNCYRRYCGSKNKVECPICRDIQPYKEFKQFIK